jgi:hypothetical protein
MLKDWKVMSEMSSAMAAEYPEMKPYIEQVEKEKDAKRKTYLGAYAILHFPGSSPTLRQGVNRETKFAQIDSLRDNWWCGKPTSTQVARGETEHPPDLARNRSALTFLSAAETQAAEKQWDELMDLNAASSEMARAVLAYQKMNPTEPTMAEALDLSLRAFRYGGCGAPAQESHQVFSVLHENYPNSAAAKRNRPWGEW